MGGAGVTAAAAGMAVAGLGAGSGVAVLVRRVVPGEDPWWPPGVVTAAAFAALWLRLQASPQLPALCYLVAVGVPLAFIDARATVNDTMNHHATSVARVAKMRREGQQAQVHFRRWSGEGSIAMQLQRRAGDPARTPETIASAAGKWSNVAMLAPHEDPGVFASLPRGERRQAARRGRLRFRIGSGPAAAHIELPVVIHRMLPADADITGIRVTRRVQAGKPQVHVCVSARIREVPRRVEGTLPGVHCGWRALPDGALRVAVIAGAGQPPEGLAGVARAHGDWAELIIPPQWRDTQARAEKIRSRRGQSMDALRARLLAWLEQHLGARPWMNPCGTMARWRSPAPFAALAIDVRRYGALGLACCGEDPASAAAMSADLEAWRQDKHLWHMEAGQRSRLLRRRDEMWRRTAAWVTADAAVVAMDEWEVAPLARRPGLTEEDDPQARAARANRVLASPGYLRQAIRVAASALGATVTEPQTTSATVHHVCGTPLDRAQRMKQVMVLCPACNVMVDQDWTALQVLLAAARER
jgi:hypothetical protein